jgi:hypothetical protein
MQLKPRLKKTEGGRRTRKLSHKQRGGADWSSIDPARASEWSTVLTESGWTADQITSYVGVEADASKRVGQYIQAVMRQDELMEAAMKLICKKLGVENTLDSITQNIGAITAADREELLTYVTDVQKLISFEVPATAAISSTLKNLSKVQRIRKASDEPIATLLLYPSRLINVFIQGLATLAIQMKREKATLPLFMPAMADKTLQVVQAEHYKSYMQSLAYTKTSKELRDGFFMDENVTEFANLMNDGFWLKFVQAMRLINADETVSVLHGDGCKTELFGTKGSTSDSWAALTAAIFNAYIKADTWDAMAFIKGFKNDACTGEGDWRPYAAYLPPEADFGAPIDGAGGLTLKMLLSQFSSYVLHYVLQLSYMLQKMEPLVSVTPL